MANITPDNHELLTTLVQRSLGLLSEVHDIERQMRKILADLTLAGLTNDRNGDLQSATTPEPAYRGSMRWNRRD